MFDFIFTQIEMCINIFSIFEEIDLIQRCIERAEIVLNSQEVNACEYCGVDKYYPSSCSYCSCKRCSEKMMCTKRCLFELRK
jgi:hypothetical protein